MYNKKLILFLITLLYIFSSFSLLYVFANFFSYEKELKDFIKNFPFSPPIIVGAISPIYANIAYRVMNKVENLIYEISGELMSTFGSLPEVNLDKLKLNDDEIHKIINLKGIKSYFLKNRAELITNYALEIPSYSNVVYVNSFPPDFINELNFPLKYGRYFTKDDHTNVVLLNEEICQMIFNDDNVVGKEINLLTDKGIEKYKIIGVLKSIPEEYIMFSSSAIIPYKKTGIRKIINYKGEEQLAESSYVLYIIPENGYERNLLKRIEKILGKEKFLYIVNSFSINLNNNLYFQIRKERISNILIISILTILINLLTISSFIIFDISTKRKIIGIKRAIGANILDIAKEYSLFIIRLLIISFPISVFLITILIKILNKFNIFGNWAPPISLTYTYNVKIDLYSVISSLVILLLMTILISTISVILSLKESPALLIKMPKIEKRMQIQIIILVLIVTLSMSITFTSFSSIINLRKTTLDLINDISIDTYRIVPRLTTSQKYKNAPTYDFEDYLELKRYLKDEAYIGFRIIIPEPVNIYIGKEKYTLRLSGATEDFPFIYNFSLKEGNFINDTDFDMCVVGYEIYKKFNLKIGDEFLGRKIVGILNKHSNLIDKTVYISIEDSASQYAPINYYAYFLIKPKNEDNKNLIDKALNILKTRHPDKDDGEVNYLKNDIEAIIYSRQGNFVTLTIYSIFAIFSSLLYLSIIFLIEGIKRIKEIGIKIAIGASRKTIMKEFLIRGFRIGIISLCLGIIFGITISMYISKKEGFMFYLSLSFLIIFILSFIIFLYLSLYIPANYASSITPNEAIKEE